MAASFCSVAPPPSPPDGWESWPTRAARWATLPNCPVESAAWSQREQHPFHESLLRSQLGDIC